ncbi:MAG TPA: DUF4389 domain-containing protein [Gammaproteobacteria bacterium]|nr:DUF4389 domain-containing protein [Gammaproteobacteria bacterium]
MDEQLKANLTRKETWIRGLFIVLFAIAFNLAEMLMVAVVVFQFAMTLVTGTRNPRVLQFARQLSTWLYQILLFVTFNRDERPWPFDAWPEPEIPRLDRRGTEGG